jgi:hypothetical protein
MTKDLRELNHVDLDRIAWRATKILRSGYDPNVFVATNVPAAVIQALYVLGFLKAPAPAPRAKRAKKAVKKGAKK